MHERLGAAHASTESRSRGPFGSRASAELSSSIVSWQRSRRPERDIEFVEDGVREPEGAEKARPTGGRLWDQTVRVRMLEVRHARLPRLASAKWNQSTTQTVITNCVRRRPNVR